MSKIETPEQMKARVNQIRRDAAELLRADPQIGQTTLKLYTESETAAERLQTEAAAGAVHLQHGDSPGNLEPDTPQSRTLAFTKIHPQ